MRQRASSQLQLPGVGVKARRTPRFLGKPVTRRDFLSRTLGWLTAAIAGTIAVPAAVMAVAPAFRKNASKWSPVVRLSEPGPGEADVSAVGQPVLTHFKILRGDAYVSPRLEQVPVYVLNRGDGRFTIYDIRCTHLGCPVSWDEKSRSFLSPCHNGVFDIDGQVVDGPPPRPLDQYEARVDDGVLYAGAFVKGGHAGSEA